MTLTETEVKQCYTCKEVLSIDMFTSRLRDCKECVRNVYFGSCFSTNIYLYIVKEGPAKYMSEKKYDK